jgi:hypothetical protein
LLALRDAAKACFDSCFRDVVSAPTIEHPNRLVLAVRMTVAAHWPSLLQFHSQPIRDALATSSCVTGGSKRRQFQRRFRIQRQQTIENHFA